MHNLNTISVQTGSTDTKKTFHRKRYQKPSNLSFSRWGVSKFQQPVLRIPVPISVHSFKIFTFKSRPVQFRWNSIPPDEVSLCLCVCVWRGHHHPRGKLWWWPPAPKNCQRTFRFLLFVLGWPFWKATMLWWSHFVKHNRSMNLNKDYQLRLSRLRATNLCFYYLFTLKWSAIQRNSTLSNVANMFKHSKNVCDIGWLNITSFMLSFYLNSVWKVTITRKVVKLYVFRDKMCTL